MKKRSRKKIWLAAAALALVVAVLPLVGLDGAADEGAHRRCIGEGCGVCELADMIYSLPADTSEITLENAAQHLDTLHAIDRAKIDAFLPYEDAYGDVYEDVYEDFAELCGGVGYGGMPTRFSAALDRISDLGMNDGGWVLIGKSILAEGKNIDFAYSDAQFRIERVGGGIAPMTVTLSGDAATMGMSWLSASPCAASVLAENGVQTGWTYKYPLPAGTYRITEVDSRTETYSGEPVPTTASVLADGEYVAGNSTEFEVTAGGTASVGFLNHFNHGILKISAEDVNGTPSGLPTSVSVKVTICEPGGEKSPAAFMDENDEPFPKDAEGNVLITLDGSNGFERMIANIPDGYTYSVAVTEVNGYGYTMQDSSNGMVTADETSQVTLTFTQTADLTITLTGQNDIVTNIPESVNVKVTLKDNGGNFITGTFDGVSFDGENGATLTMGRDIDGNGTSLTSATIEGLPSGGTYKISLPNVNGYTPQYGGYDSEETLAPNSMQTIVFHRDNFGRSIDLYDEGGSQIDAVAELIPEVEPKGDGTYTLEWGKEYTVTAPEGYESEEPIKFSLDRDGTLTQDSSSAVVYENYTLKVTFTRKPHPVYICTEDTNGNPVGAGFYFDREGRHFMSSTVDGVYIFDGVDGREDALEWGDKEYSVGIASSPGYMMSGPFCFTVNRDGTVAKVDPTDERFRVDGNQVFLTAEYRTCTVTFMDGDRQVEAKTIPVNTAVTPPTLPDRDGYELSGWLDESGGTFNFEMLIYQDCTLTADWDEEEPENPEPPVYNGGGGGGGGVPSAPLKDTDGDGIPDILDDDDDNDGLLDFEDPDPLTPNVVDLGSDICDRFDDLEHGAWYEEYIQYVVENGLMEGISDALFDPNGTTSRAQIIMTLWRMEGEPLVTHPLYFADVSEGAWYADALRWTNSEGIVLGYDDGRFGTGDPVTREQIATILWRYTRFKGIDTSSGESTSLLKFSDAKKISAYAISALQWACGEELIRGTVIDDGSIVLDPQGSATRAQVAAILMRFCENIL